MQEAAGRKFFPRQLVWPSKAIKKPALQSAENKRRTTVQTRMRLREAAILSSGKKRANLLSLIKGQVALSTTKIFSDLAKKILGTRW